MGASSHSTVRRIGLLITQVEMLERLRKHVAKSEAIDIATAWASPGEAVDIILGSSAKIRAIIGTTGSSTHPTILQCFNKAGQLRIPAESPLFHAKMILFHSRKTTTAWVGSANLTNGGYAANLEIMFEHEDDGASLKWFNSVWGDLILDPTDQINIYEKYWTQYKRTNHLSTVQSDIRKNDNNYSSLLDSIDSWESFVDAIKTADNYWRSEDANFSVFGDTVSWLETALLGNAIIKFADFGTIGKHEFHVLMGIQTEGTGYGLLGSMGGAGYAKQIFNTKTPETLSARRDIQRYLKPVLESSFDDFPEVTSEFIESVSSIRGISGSVATRLITLARPDLGVSVNKGSKNKLSRYAVLPKGTLSKPEKIGRTGSYADLIRFLQTQPWYYAPRPKNQFEKSLADNRAALLDSLAYEVT